MHRADEVGERIPAVANIAVVDWRHLLLVVDHNSECLQLVHDFDFREWLDESFLGLEACVLWPHREVEPSQDDRVDAWNCCDVHLGGWPSHARLGNAKVFTVLVMGGARYSVRSVK